MALVDLWTRSKDQLLAKQVQQLLAIAGDGRLRDGNAASAEFREFLAAVPSDLVARYASECLTESFPDSGHTLQDLVNQIGVRLGFEVTYGRYRGTTAHIGHDGLWRSPTGRTIVVEVKTTDAYRVDLNIVAGYRRALISDASLVEADSSILIVVGRQDTGDLEAQIRGSRHAWDVRLISIDGLVRLMAVKEAVEDPAIVKRIHQILVPREFTRIDEIVDVLFSTAEDLRQEVDVSDSEGGVEEKKFTPVSFHAACVARIETTLGKALVQRSRTTFLAPDKSARLVCAVSREYLRSGQQGYWFAFHEHQREFAAAGPKSYVAFGCGSPERLLVIPFGDFAPYLEKMNVTELETRSYSHVHIVRDGESYSLLQKKGFPRVDVSAYLLPRVDQVRRKR